MTKTKSNSKSKSKSKGDKSASSGGRPLDPLLLTPGYVLSNMIKAGTVSSERVCQVFIERIKEVQPHINAVTEGRFEQALEEARAVDLLVARFRHSGPATADPSGPSDPSGQQSESQPTADQLQMLASPLLGVPLSVKESIQLTGMRNTCGSWAHRQERAQRDALTVANARRLGLVPLCTTNVPEMTLYWADCANPVYGRTRNPYDLGRITGASSGGEAALLAAAGSVCGLGSDMGGSLRSPAHYCGVFSHKPTPFLVSCQGNTPAVLGSRLRLFTLGPMTRYASDLRHLLRVLMADVQLEARANSDPDPALLAPELHAQREQMYARLEEPIKVDELSQVKLFYCDLERDSMRVNPVTALVLQRESRVQSAICEAQHEAVEHLAAKFNCATESIDLEPYLSADVFELWLAMLLCGAGADHETAFEPHETNRVLGIKSAAWESLKWLMGASHHTKETIATLLVAVNNVPQDPRRAYEHCAKYERRAQELRDKLIKTLGPNGVLVVPTLPTQAHRHHAALLRRNEVRFAALFNCLQLPVTHATLKLDAKNKLPVGVSLVTTPFRDHVTIALAEELESAFGGWTVPSLPSAAAANTQADERDKSAKK